jgi:NADH-quinone oxidoreductase subunit L
MDPASALPALLLVAWLLPLASFTLIVLAGPKLGPAGKMAGFVATGAIVTAFVLSMIALFAVWLPAYPPTADLGHAAETGDHDDEARPGDAPEGDAPEGESHADGSLESGPPIATVAFAQPAEAEESTAADYHDTHAAASPHVTGEWYLLGKFGKLRLSISYYIDALTVAMFCMITLIASCIHFYAMGYMHEELHDVTDHEVTLANGEHLHRRGRYYRFFQYLSLFCFSMLGLIVAGNVAMVFVFWELVGICSYFLIGFYIERKSASNAANKAFIVNRVGDFGMLIGMMALWASLGTFAFGDVHDAQGHLIEQGVFSQIRPADHDHELITPDGMVKFAARDEIAQIVLDHVAQAEGSDALEVELANAKSEIEARIPEWREEGMGYWLLVVAGIGIFCGCVGKSAQFPLHVWLPDAMEGPTPVSALVHSATMVAAGVYLVGRFYPAFAPEVLLVIAYIGCITLFLAATIAITATDIKRVLAYSTVSQLGYMMLALGVGGWLAGMFHLITHAFFKSLLFLCSGSVIHAVHTNEMPQMGGLRKKMPITAYTMLVGCLAIIGAGIPMLIGFSGYYSKDSILEQAWSFSVENPVHSVLFYAAAGGAAMTAFYMFRLWFMTFAGKPRDQHRYDHAHESPRVMTTPLIVLAVFAISVGWTLPGTNLNITNLLEQARAAGTLVTVSGGELLAGLTVPHEHLSHDYKLPMSLVAFSTALAGVLLAAVMYGWKLVDPAEIRQQFGGLYRFLVNKWWFDELYNAVFVQPTLFISRRIAQLDRAVIDWLVDHAAIVTRWFSQKGEALVDQGVVDGSVNVLASRVWRVGLSLHHAQTGNLRQYVMFIVVGTVALFVLISFVWSFAFAQ